MTKDYQFLGNVYPPGVLNITNFELNASEIVGVDNSLNGELKLSIHQDQVIVTFKTRLDFDSDLDTLRKSLEYFSRAAIDSANYYFGIGVDLYLTFGGNIVGEFYSFPPKVNSLYNEYNKRPIEPLELTMLATKNMQLRRALEQAKNAITNVTDTGLHCYRAIEAIRRDFLEEGKDEGVSKKRSWDQMNGILKLNQSYYSLIKEHADEARHGGLKSATSAEIEEMLHKTWQIIDRYIIYLKNGKEDLGKSFEVLE